MFSVFCAQRKQTLSPWTDSHFLFCRVLEYKYFSFIRHVPSASSRRPLTGFPARSAARRLCGLHRSRARVACGRACIYGQVGAADSCTVAAAVTWSLSKGGHAGRVPINEACWLLCSCEECFAYGVAIESVRRYIDASLFCLMIALCDVCTSCCHAVHSSDMCYAAIAVCAQTPFRHRSWLARESERGGERQFVRQTPLVIIKCIARSHARANACHTWDASAAVHLSSSEFRDFLAILFSWVHIVEESEELEI